MSTQPTGASGSPGAAVARVLADFRSITATHVVGAPLAGPRYEDARGRHAA